MQEYNITIIVRGQLYDITLEAQNYFDALVKGRNAGMQLKVSPKDVAVVGMLDSSGKPLM